MTGSAQIRIDAWPAVMTASMAAAYCGEKSVEAFRRRVEQYYPKPTRVSGRGDLWLKEDLDVAIRRMLGDADPISAAEVL